jgi:hypothetical protein
LKKEGILGIWRICEIGELWKKNNTNFEEIA